MYHFLSGNNISILILQTRKLRQRICLRDWMDESKIAMWDSWFTIHATRIVTNRIGNVIKMGEKCEVYGFVSLFWGHI